PPGYEVDHAMVPHGVSVILSAPAVFRFTAQACPERHLQAAEALGSDISRVKPDDAGQILADRLIGMMRFFNLPNGLAALGYTRADIP
ncbi:iron-containing alcohol dehydrogenase, partial [Vibrio vulnificus]|uniref:iron-containing alcohol dehydrogenase n=1 Tax=Vibrio vulnificus TaxID=672 RepID=UPI0039B421FF